MTDQPDCCLCGKPCEPWHAPPTGFGHDPDPFGNGEDDRCCNACNDEKVLPARLSHFFGRPK